MVRRLRVTSALALLLPIAGCSLLVDSAGLDDPGAGAPAPNPWIDASVASDGATADAGLGELDATTLGGPVDGEADGARLDGSAGDGSAGDGSVREAGPSDAGTTDAGAAEAGLDAGPSLDAGTDTGNQDAAVVTGTPGVIACGITTCATPDFCCGDFASPTATCVPTTATCPAASELHCDEKADCGGNNVCCLGPDQYATNLPTAECKPGCAGGGKATLCSSTADCSVGLCTPISCKGRSLATCGGVVPGVCN